MGIKKYTSIIHTVEQNIIYSPGFQVCWCSAGMKCMVHYYTRWIHFFYKNSRCWKSRGDIENIGNMQQIGQNQKQKRLWNEINFLDKISTTVIEQHCRSTFAAVPLILSMGQLNYSGLQEIWYEIISKMHTFTKIQPSFKSKMNANFLKMWRQCNGKKRSTSV